MSPARAGMLALLWWGGATGCMRVRTVEVTFCAAQTAVLSTLSASASTIHRSTLGEVMTADKPPTEPTNYWWVVTPNGRGVVGGAAATHFPMPAEEYVVVTQDAPQFADPAASGTSLRTLSRGARVKLSRGGTCVYREGMLAVVEAGRPVAFMRAADVAPADR